MNNNNDNKDDEFEAEQIIINTIKKQWDEEDRMEVEKYLMLKLRFPNLPPPIVDQELVRIKNEIRHAEIESLQKTWIEWEVNAANVLRSLQRDHPELF